MDDLDLARLSKKLKKFVMMRKVGVPQVLFSSNSLRIFHKMQCASLWSGVRHGVAVYQRKMFGGVSAAVGAYPGSRDELSTAVMGSCSLIIKKYSGRFPRKTPPSCRGAPRRRYQYWDHLANYCARI